MDKNIYSVFTGLVLGTVIYFCINIFGLFQSKSDFLDKLLWPLAIFLVGILLGQILFDDKK